MLGALLDRSLAQIADASADARHFDREVIRRAADVWDNNTYPLFLAATAGTHRGRERRGLAALEWMAGLGEERRSWVVRQAEAAGHRLDEMLAPAEPYTPGRDYRGRVMAPRTAITPRIARSLAADYDLTSAEVRHLLVERAGRRLDGYLELAVARAYPIDEDTCPETAILGIRLRDITEVRFDSHDARGAALPAEPGTVSIRIGSRGTLRAGAADVYPDDRCWHLSAAGLLADAAVPPRDGRPARVCAPQEGRLGTHAAAAAVLLHRAMLEIRMVRSTPHAPRVPVRAFHRALTGAGGAIVAAGASRLPQRREAAFRRLIETWARRGGPALADWFVTVLRETAAHQPDFLSGLRAQARERPLRAAPRQPATHPSEIAGPPEAELRLAAYSSAHTRYGTHHDASALLHLAAAPHPASTEDAPWRLRAVQGATTARFQVRTEAFQGACRPRRVTAEDGATRQLVLHDGTLTVTSGR